MLASVKEKMWWRQVNTGVVFHLCRQLLLSEGLKSDDIALLCIPTCACGVVSIPEYVGLHRHSPPWRPNHRVLGVVAQTGLKITVGYGRVKGWLCGAAYLESVGGSLICNSIFTFISIFSVSLSFSSTTTHSTLHTTEVYGAHSSLRMKPSQ